MRLLVAILTAIFALQQVDTRVGTAAAERSRTMTTSVCGTHSAPCIRFSRYSILTIVRKGATGRFRWNGRRLRRPFISHARLVRGGTLTFE